MAGSLSRCFAEEERAEDEQWEEREEEWENKWEELGGERKGAEEAQEEEREEEWEEEQEGKWRGLGAGGARGETGTGRGAVGGGAGEGAEGLKEGGEGQTVEHIKKSQEVMIAFENKRRRQSTFQVGERVWVKASELGQEFGISRKLMPQYFGPWEVLDIVGNDMDGPYVIRIRGHLRTYPVFHASKLAPFAETAQFPSRRSMLPPTMDGQVDVDDILDHRDTLVPKPPGRGRPPKPAREFRVHFRHHTDPKEDRWISREELVKTAPQMVADYEKRLKGKAPA
ncbi:hypothetical protein CBR_g49883 [Chara braunii]|uniref:Tf2-1-like SH3-like domain-containing protein n=1 Tax=Chara braunii TaxID=69332 RepID=A0A388JPC9_CHABU|nr:hypothetical protein CBR_g49883 [Chara braunii]|eukprot:GBG59618.1 hypothetical protein CBR_g49883 [Chara braunii]